MAVSSISSRVLHLMPIQIHKHSSLIKGRVGHNCNTDKSDTEKMKIHKRSFSPTIDEIRQYNIKKQRLLDDFDSLNLSMDSSHQVVKPYEKLQPQSSKEREYIPDIDEFLLLNQDDRDVLESSKHILEWDDAGVNAISNGLKVVIPEKVTRISGLTEYDERTSLERILGKRKFDELLGKNKVSEIGVGITEEEILLDYEIRTNWSLVRYVPPWMVIYQHWEKWWMNVHKLDEFMRQMSEDNDMMMDDEYGDGGDYMNTEEDPDAMDIDD